MSPSFALSHWKMELPFTEMEVKTKRTGSLGRAMGGCKSLVCSRLSLRCLLVILVKILVSS